MINPQPMKIYTPPQLPTFADVRGNPAHAAVLKRLPLRWKKSAAILAIAGVVGTIALTGCGSTELDDSGNPAASGSGAASGGGSENSSISGGGANSANPAHSLDPNYVPHVPVQEDLELRLHSGGSGSAVYIVHLTEAEALGIVRSRLEAAGLQFTAEPPDVVAGSDGWTDDAEVTLDLFDPVRDVAVALMSWQQNNINFFRHGDGHIEVRREFEEQIDSTVGVFYAPGQMIQNGRDEGELLPPPTDEQLAAATPEARTALESRLTEQIDAFIASLRGAGVIS
jgi:hypothetical protein